MRGRHLTYRFEMRDVGEYHTRNKDDLEIAAGVELLQGIFMIVGRHLFILSASLDQVAGTRMHSFQPKLNDGSMLTLASSPSIFV